MAAPAEFSPVLAKHKISEENRGKEEEIKSSGTMEVSDCLFLKEPLDTAVLLMRIRQKRKMECLRRNAERFLSVASQGADQFMDCFSSP
jgi:hypothetical protein